MNIKQLILYSSAICNLNCRYCFISKNKSLGIVDKDLEESFKDIDYYLNMIKSTGTDLNLLEEIGVWGSEPTLGLDRIFPLLTEIIKLCPNFKKISFSSNMCSDKLFTSIQGLMDIFSKFAYRRFTLDLQVSIDGPTDITDECRGKGTTETVLKNLYTLMYNNFYATDNVKVQVHCKGTVDQQNLSKFLDKDYIINYYKFFEDNIIEPFKNHNSNIYELTGYPNPNVAIPGPFTVEDGKNFYKICRLFSQINIENQQNKIFKYYKDIRWFRTKQLVKSNKNECSFFMCGGLCGSGDCVLGILPHGIYSGCHRSFPDYCEKYLDNYNNGVRTDTSLIQPNNTLYDPLLFNGLDALNTYSSAISTMYNNSSVLRSNLVVQIMELANNGMILSKYSNLDEALKAASNLSYITTCMSANVTATGDLWTESYGKLKLFLNGALDEIVRDN